MQGVLSGLRNKQVGSITSIVLGDAIIEAEWTKQYKKVNKTGLNEKHLSTNIIGTKCTFLEHSIYLKEFSP